MSVLNLNPRDLHIKKLDDGKEVVQIKGFVAFDEDFISECRQNGVKDFEEREQETD